MQLWKSQTLPTQAASQALLLWNRVFGSPQRKIPKRNSEHMMKKLKNCLTCPTCHRKILVLDLFFDLNDRSCAAPILAQFTGNSVQFTGISLRQFNGVAALQQQQRHSLRQFTGTNVVTSRQTFFKSLLCRPARVVET